MTDLIGNNALQLNSATVTAAITFWLQEKVLSDEIDLENYDVAVRYDNNDLLTVSLKRKG